MPKKGQVPEFIYKRNDMQENIAAWASLCGNGSYLQMIKNFAFSQW